MEDPWKPVVNTVTIRLDGKGNKSGRRKKKWEKWRRREGEGEGGERVAVDVPMCSSTKSINLVCSSEHVGQQCPLREQPRRTSLRPLFRPRFHVVGVPGGEGGRERGLYPPSLLERCQQHRVARKLPMPRRYTAKGSPAHRPLLKDRSSATPRNSLRGK